MTTRDVIAANREYFDRNATTYEREESCIIDTRSQETVAKHLDRLVSRLRDRFGAAPIQVLDAGGGSGNVSLKLIERGVVPELVDVSGAMIRLYISKVPAGLQEHIVTTCSDLETFFTESKTRYHLICFSSVLHHLFDYRVVLSLAAAHLVPGGMIYTIHDPSPSNAFWNRVDMADYHLSTFRRLIAYLGRRLGVGPHSEPHADTVDEAVVEPHVAPGIDDLALDQFLRDLGLNIVWHERYATARTWPAAVIYRLGRHARGFSFAAENTA